MSKFINKKLLFIGIIIGYIIGGLLIIYIIIGIIRYRYNIYIDNQKLNIKKILIDYLKENIIELQLNIVSDSEVGSEEDYEIYSDSEEDSEIYSDSEEDSEIYSDSEEDLEEIYLHSKKDIDKEIYSHLEEDIKKEGKKYFNEFSINQRYYSQKYYFYLTLYEPNLYSIRIYIKYNNEFVLIINSINNKIYYYDYNDKNENGNVMMYIFNVEICEDNNTYKCKIYKFLNEYKLLDTK